MIPSGRHPVWAKLIRGELECKFSSAAASMLILTLRRQYRQQPGELPEQIEQARQFFTKYEAILASDMAQLFPAG